MDAEKVAEGLTHCSWPALGDHYDSALREAVEYILQRFDVLGILACGSIIRGNPDASSDFDLYVINAEPFRQRIQKRFGGVPAEIFINPPHQVRVYFAEEYAAGRPCTAHMLSTGHVVLSNDPVIEQLIDDARSWLDKPSALSEQNATLQRYLMVDLLDNAEDLRQTDAENAALFLHQAVRAMLDYVFCAAGRFLPRTKELLSELDRSDPSAGRLARTFYRAADNDARFEAARSLADQILGETTFFEWESEQGQLPPPPLSYTKSAKLT